MYIMARNGGAWRARGIRRVRENGTGLACLLASHPHTCIIIMTGDKAHPKAYSISGMWLPEHAAFTGFGVVVT